ncbi:uncharacterized protein VTP21DRAFT_4494 [Calcarisporiella thermophila]|uniref:uncharacterized protein n=1 Tax=Calcarisporiella thermophila TaxID=911321 RepID=UPI00374361E1
METIAPITEESRLPRFSTSPDNLMDVSELAPQLNAQDLDALEQHPDWTRGSSSQFDASDFDHTLELEDTRTGLTEHGADLMTEDSERIRRELRQMREIAMAEGFSLATVNGSADHLDKGGDAMVRPAINGTKMFRGTNLNGAMSSNTVNANGDLFRRALVGAVKENGDVSLRTEVEVLRRENERLVEDLSRFEGEINKIISDKEMEVMKVREDCEKLLRDIRSQEQEKQSELRRQLNLLQAQLDSNHSYQNKISEIRERLEQEKGFEITRMKQMLTSQKERALEELQRDLTRKRMEFDRRLQEEIEAHQDIALKEKQAREELEEARSRIKQLENQIVGAKTQEREKDELKELRAFKDNIEQRLNDMMRAQGGPYSTDLSAEEVLECLQGLFEDKDAQITRLKKQLASPFASRPQQGTATSERKLSASSYDIALAEIKALYRAETDKLRRERDAARAQLMTQLSPPRRSPPMDSNRTLPELINAFPLQFAQYRTKIEAEHQRALEDLRASHDGTVAGLVRRSEEEKRAMIEQHHADLRDLADRIKEKCCRAYELAVKQLKAELKEFYQTGTEGERRELHHRSSKRGQLRER